MANLMFELPAVSVSQHDRNGPGIWFSEVVATCGLLLVILGLVPAGRSGWVAAAVAAYIVNTYWFTASTSFANPAVTIEPTFSDTFAGISPTSVPGSVVAQCMGGLLTALVTVVLWPQHSTKAAVAIDLQTETR